jgi:imidazolonepropionase-like amidohydrolase
MSRLMQQVAALAAVVTVSATPVAAQLGSYNPRPGPQATFVIRNARIVPVVGAEIANGSLVISGGKITAIGATVATPAGATVIDATGLTVYPGMMDAGNQIGLAEIPQGANATMDASEVGSFNPQAHALNGFNPHSAMIGVTRVVGITHVVTRPSSGVISGTAALMHLAGDTPPAMAAVPKVAMVITLPGGGGGRGGGGGFGGGGAGGGGAATAQRDSLKAMFEDARAYGKATAAAASDKSVRRPPTDLALEALQPVVNGTMPVLFAGTTAANIRDIIAFSDSVKIRPIILGGRDALQVADLLKEKNVPVLLSGVRALPSREDDAYDVNYTLPAKLAAAGVRFAITSGEDTPDTRDLPYVAGVAAAFGLSRDDALKAVTLWPAQIFGVGDKLGSLEVGKVANLVVTTGDLLEARTETKYLFIDGRMVPLDTKHSQLWEMFKDR